MVTGVSVVVRSALSEVVVVVFAFVEPVVEQGGDVVVKADANVLSSEARLLVEMMASLVGLKDTLASMVGGNLSKLITPVLKKKSKEKILAPIATHIT